MKSFILFLLATFTVVGINAQTVTIDPNFASFLFNNGWASCVNGNVLDIACANAAPQTAMDCSNSGITDLTGIEYFSNLTELNCSYNQMTILNALPPGITILYCSNNHLSALPILPNGIQILNCGYNNLIGLPSFPISLTNLNCEDNYGIVSDPGLPNTIQILNISSTGLTSIVLPNSLVELYASYCPSLPTFTSLPNNLSGLECAQDTFSTLPPLPSTLTYLYTNYTPLTYLPTLPSGLTTLVCNSNRLTNLPTLPSTLQSLDCGGNVGIHSLPTLPAGLLTLTTGNLPSLHTLPILPSALTTLSCGGDSLTALPALPPGLQLLTCSYNFLTSFPPIPASVYRLDASVNRLTTIPALTNTIIYLDLNQNNLTSFSNIPSHLTYFDCSYNPNLTCLPPFQNISTFKFNNTGITCLPNHGTVTTSTPLLSTVPLCGINNTNGCGAFWNLSGQAFYSTTNTCTYNVGDTVQANVKVQLYQGGVLQQQVFTGGEGLYSFDVHNTYGTYATTIDTSQLPFAMNCPGAAGYTSVISATDSMYPSNNFAFKCKSGVDIGATNMVAPIGRARPGHVVEIDLTAGDVSHLYGANCAAGTSGVVKVSYNNMGIFQGMVAGSLAPTSVANNTLTWNIADFATVHNQTDFKMLFLIDSTSLYWTSLDMGASARIGSMDNNPSNDTLTFSTPISNSFDPNVKEVSPQGPFDTVQGWLTYTIRFQNTGNAPALNIYVLDTLDANLDVSTIELLSYSHRNVTQVLPGGIVRFNFPNINLPDSTTNEPGSHGFVQYRIKAKRNLPFGTSIKNAAYIYFDFNPAVITNTTSSNYGRLTPSIATTQPITFCQGDSVTLHATGTSAYPVQWLKNGAAISSETNNSITVHTAGEYSLRVYYAGDSSTSNGVPVIVKSLPAVTLTSAKDTVCGNAPGVQLTTSPSGGIFASRVITGNVFEPSTGFAGNNTITYLYTDTNGCLGSASTVITINAVPNVNVSAPVGSVCVNGSIITLTSSPSGGTFTGFGVGNNTFNPAQANTGANTIGYAYTDVHGCSGSASTVVTVYALPTVTLNPDTNITYSCKPPIQLNGAPSGGYYAGSGITDSIFNPSHAQGGIDTIEYHYTDGNGCSAVAKTTIENFICVGIENTVNSFDINIFPNPTNDAVNIRIKGGENFTVSLFSINGLLLQTQTINSGTSTIDMSNLASGIYYFEFANMQGKVIKKVVKM